MTNKNFKKLTETKIKENQSIKHSIVWKIIRGDLKIDCKNKEKSLTKKQYKKILAMEN